jgi:hypothetical protein
VLLHRAKANFRVFYEKSGAAGPRPAKRQGTG